MKVLVTVEIEIPDTEDESEGALWMGSVLDLLKCELSRRANPRWRPGDTVLDHPYKPKIISSYQRCGGQKNRRQA